MTETQSYTIPGSHNVQIPTKEEFHRYAMNLLHEEDFSTSYPSEHVAQNIASSFRWTKSNSKNHAWCTRW